MLQLRADLYVLQDACLAEDTVAEMRQCIRLCLDCTGICVTTGAMATRRTGSNVEVLQEVMKACEAACRTCGQECQQHAELHDHCRICAEACLRCAESCRDALNEVSEGGGLGLNPIDPQPAQ